MAVAREVVKVGEATEAEMEAEVKEGVREGVETAEVKAVGETGVEVTVGGW